MIPLEFRLIALLVVVIGLWAGFKHEVSLHDASVKAGLVAAQLAQQAAKDQAVSAAQTEIGNESQRMATRARDDALLGADSHVRLSERFTTALGPGISAPHGAGPAASSPSDLPADVFRRIDEAAGQLAIAADDSYIAGLSCERKYEALK